MSETVIIIHLITNYKESTLKKKIHYGQFFRLTLKMYVDHYKLTSYCAIAFT